MLGHYGQDEASRSHRGRQNPHMKKPSSPAVSLYTRLNLQSQLIGHMADRARINPAAPGAGIKVAQLSAKMLDTVRALDAGKR